MEDDAPIIYGLEFQARALTPQVAETDVIRFLVGTQSLKNENQVHLLEFDDDNNILNKTVYLHKEGEIWHISSNPDNKNILSTCYNQIVDNKVTTQAALWRIPSESDPADKNDDIQDDTNSYAKSLDVICRFDSSEIHNMISILWEPQGDGTKAISISDSHLTQWDIEASSSKAQVSSSVALEGKGHPKFTAGRWNPHHNNTQVATANDTTIRGWDLRSMKQCYSIDNAHNQLVRDLDFNPNKQYYLVSCGDDCKVKFWDVRNTASAVLTLMDHSHWVWSVRYNQFHDQLVLTSSSDSRVILSSVASISSEPFGHLDDEEEEDSDIEDGTETKTQEPSKDGLIANYEEHEDSVYTAEWSSVDPWLFASLSYDGRLVINRVPKAEKYKILL